MSLKTWRFITLMLVALSMAMSFCHLLELSARLRYDAPLWVTITKTQNPFYGSFSAFFEIVACLAVVGLLFSVVARRPAFHWTLFGTTFLIIAMVLWWAFILPVNSEISTWALNKLPADWLRWRNQWEYTHAVRAVLQMVGFAALTASVLAETPETVPAARLTAERALRAS